MKKIENSREDAKSDAYDKDGIDLTEITEYNVYVSQPVHIHRVVAAPRSLPGPEAE